MSVRLVDLTADDVRSWLGPALDVYVAAMNYPRGTQTHRAPLWQDHMNRPGWQAVGAVHSHVPSPIDSAAGGRATGYTSAPALAGTVSDTPTGTVSETLVGISYGYRGAEDQWWNQQLRAGLRLGGYTRAQIDEITLDYFELTELHVHPSMQGTGTGQLMLTRLLRDRMEKSVLLSTPEVPGDDNRAWRLYRRLGFGDMLRHFSFTGDPRPFAVLGRRLPLV